MATVVKMPKLGMTMEEGTVISWLIKEGESVTEGEPLLSIESDKTTFEENAPVTGIVRKILAPEGTVVAVGGDLAIITSADERLINKEPDRAEQIISATGLKEQAAVTNAFFYGNLGTEAAAKPDKIKASPAAKRIAGEQNIDLAKITAANPEGRIEKKDVLAYLEKHKPQGAIIKENAGETCAAGQDAARHTREGLSQETDIIGPIQELIPVTGMRKIIAEKMVKSKNEAPHIYLTLNVNMKECVELREKLNTIMQSKNQAKVSFNDILIKASAMAIREMPIINSSFNETGIVIKKEINIGLAVALDSGLIVPVVKNADKKGLGRIALETSELIQKAKNNKLLPDEFSGGTFTITNLGMYDIENFAAVINRPESAILAVGQILKKPVVIGERIEIRPMMSLTLSCDHRSIDGAEGAKFLQRVKQILVEPAEILLF